MTLSILEDYLQGFPGPILIVSHDRFLLDKLAEQVFEVRDGEVLRYSGNWSDWKAKRKEEEAPAKAEKPKAAQERPRAEVKFTFREQREFETIDEDLAALEQQIKDCEEAQSACGSDYVRLQELQAKQAELEAALEEKTERWMYSQSWKEKSTHSEFVLEWIQSKKDGKKLSAGKTVIQISWNRHDLGHACSAFSSSSTGM